MRRHAFTLIELLVVVSIIALLIAILLPALSQAKRMALKVACGSDLRQVGIALTAYATDHRGYYPHHAAGFPTEVANGHSDIRKPLLDYGQTSMVYDCPASDYQDPPNDREFFNVQPTHGTWGNQFVTSHIITAGIDRVSPVAWHDYKQANGVDAFRIESVSQHMNPRLAVISIDRAFSRPGFGFGTSTEPGAREKDVNHLHDGVVEGVNVAHMDGHVAWSGAGAFEVLFIRQAGVSTVYQFR